MIRKLLAYILGEYNLDKTGISINNIISNSYISNFGKDTDLDVKITSKSKLHNFFYDLYNK